MAVYYNWTDTLTFPMDQAECTTKCDVTQKLLKGDKKILQENTKVVQDKIPTVTLQSKAEHGMRVETYCGLRAHETQLFHCILILFPALVPSMQTQLNPKFLLCGEARSSLGGNLATLLDQPIPII